MIWRLILKNIFIRANKTLIVLLSIVVGASIIFSFSAIYFDISTKMSKELRTFGANFFIAPKNIQEKFITIQDYEKALTFIDKSKLTASSPEIFGLVRLDLGNAIMAGIDFIEAKKLNPFWQVEGKWIEMAFDERNCMIGKVLAKNMELKLGDMVNIKNTNTGFKTSLKIRGIIETGKAGDSQVFVNLPLAQKILNQKNINYAKLSLSYSQDDIEQLSQKIKKQIPTLDAKPIRKISQSEGQILNKIKTLMALVAILILSITTICVNTTLIASIRERGKEIALQKTLGASDKMIIKQFLGENTIVCLIGVMIGSFAGYLLAQLMAKAVFDSYVDIRFWVIPITLIISYIATMVASYFPIKNALKILPAILLRGE